MIIPDLNSTDITTLTSEYSSTCLHKECLGDVNIGEIILADEMYTLDILSKIYSIRNYREVSKFISRNKSINEDLFNLYFKIKDYFITGLDSICLDTVTDIDDGDYVDLFVIIYTSLKVEKAMDKFSKLENDYLKNVLIQNKYSFNVDIDYV